MNLHETAAVHPLISDLNPSQARVLDDQLADRAFIGGDYSIADMACYPWIVPHQRQRVNIEEFPNVKRWFERIFERPGTLRAYAIAEEINTAPVVSEASRPVLFGRGRRVAP